MTNHTWRHTSARASCWCTKPCPWRNPERPCRCRRAPSAAGTPAAESASPPTTRRAGCAAGTSPLRGNGP
eukprot:5626453-Lingulodinium_polyedra.AAC.1